MNPSGSIKPSVSWATEATIIPTLYCALKVGMTEGGATYFNRGKVQRLNPRSHTGCLSL